MRGVLWQCRVHDHGDMHLIERWTIDDTSLDLIDWRLTMEQRNEADRLRAGMRGAGIGWPKPGEVSNG